MARKKAAAKKQEEPKTPTEHVVELPEAPEIDASELPILDAITMYKLPDHGNHGWVVLRLKIQGDKVIDIETSEPNLRQIAIEQLKMDTVKLFFNPFE